MSRWKKSAAWPLVALLMVPMIVSADASAARAHDEASALAPTAKVLSKRLDGHYNRLHSLSADFTEVYSGMGIHRTERGTLVLAKSGKMRWSYTDPRGKVFIIDGKSAYSYAPGDAQAQRYPAKQFDDFRSPLRLLLGHAHLAKELKNLSISPDGANYQLSGIPRGMEKRVSELDLTVTGEGTILAMRLKETDGATTEFSFTDEKENPTVAPDAFHFQPPPGVVVVNGLAPI